MHSDFDVNTRLAIEGLLDIILYSRFDVPSPLEVKVKRYLKKHGDVTKHSDEYELMLHLIYVGIYVSKYVKGVNDVS